MNIVKKCRYGTMIFPSQDIWQGRAFELYGEFSESEVHLFQAVIKPGWTVFDVGANIGSHTVPFSGIVGSTGLVVAVEPERHAFFTLCGNISINNIRNVFAFQYALGAEVGTIDIPEVNFDRNPNVGRIELWRDYSKEPHYSITLNTIDEIKVDEVHFIKIDVEGMEKDVLVGGKATIEKHKPIIYVENDRPDRYVSLCEYLDSIDYKYMSHYAPMFNSDNYCKVPDNVFGKIVSLNMLCWHSSLECPVDIDKYGLVKTKKPTIRS